jgi:antitoxin MazE
MTTKLILIGNSKGVRIPKAMIQQFGLDNGDIVLQAEEDGLLIKPVKKPRAGWNEQFSKAVKNNKKMKEEVPYIQNNFDETEWTW